MALTEFQREVCEIIAANRVAQGESYVAGGTALNVILDASRVSRDIDLFHDTDEALRRTWDADSRLLRDHGYRIEVLRDRGAYVEALVSKADQAVMMEWARDSAFRFFPLVRDELFGLTLHAFDLATNKALALVGRLEVRGWIDLIHCHERIQQLGYLLWAACGKDPGFSPRSLLEEARRSSHYSAVEIAELSFTGSAPEPEALCRQWHNILSQAERIIGVLPAEQAGRCVVAADGRLFRGEPEDLEGALKRNAVHFHAGTLRGALPRIVSRPTATP